ncbi:MAG: efflux RND transporter periplasmic adaptor subunit [Rhodocyclaceae bacterium]|nr:MAG: efflux RND transporter periplasmic adaptor subunit [Rhodocyclaceae bacterium]
MLQHIFLVLAFGAALAGCNKGPQASDKAAVAAADVLIAPEDLITVRNGSLVSGPVITGSIQPERRADLRAEVSAVVLRVLKENGESVKRGELLVRLDDTSIRDSVTSAEAAARSATQTFDQTERQLQRLKTLRGSGMASLQQLEDTEIRRNNAQSDLVAAQARNVQARQQLQRTEVRAPFDGVVSERKVSAGDTAQIGKELLKVVDTTSMRFEGFVSADRISSVKLGQNVAFRVNGYNQKIFSGTVKRVDPAANPTTRQVEVLVGFIDSTQPRVSGLYAEGRIEAGSSQVLMIPDAAVVRNGDKTYAWRVADARLVKTSLVVGERDPRRGDFAVLSGLSDGDQVVRNPLSTLKDGQQVVAATAAPAAAVAVTPDTLAKPSDKPAAGG